MRIESPHILNRSFVMRISTGELKQVHIEEKDVRSIMKSLTNIRNDGTVRQGGKSTNI